MKIEKLYKYSASLRLCVKFLILISFSSCGNPAEVNVKHVGALMEIMHQGKYQARIDLDSILRPGTYAVGALDSLSGEVMIDDDKLYFGRVKTDVAEAPNTATLLVYARVEEWEEYETSDYVEILDKHYEKVGKAFPFRITGTFPKAEYHVLNFDTKTGDLSRHKEGSFYGNLDNQDVVIVGFYSTQHEGVFTHKGSKTHMHIRNTDGSKMGHLDKLETSGDSFKLFLPKEN